MNFRKMVMLSPLFWFLVDDVHNAVNSRGVSEMTSKTPTTARKPKPVNAKHDNRTPTEGSSNRVQGTILLSYKLWTREAILLLLGGAFFLLAGLVVFNIYAILIGTGLFWLAKNEIKQQQKVKGAVVDR